MSARQSSDKGAAPARRSAQFAALGDDTRLMLVARLSSGHSQSITELAAGSRLTRQAVTKHLRVLAGAGMVRCKRAGRESLYTLQPEPIAEMNAYLDSISRQWDQTLDWLKKFVEE